MQPDFWHQRWADNKIGFHQDRVTPLLERYWDAIEAPAGSRVFVPLCGKSLDMPWLASRGHRVLGVELSQMAVDQFFEALQVEPSISTTRYGRHHVAGEIEIIVGDVFDLDAHALSVCEAVFDRAALIALPPELRRRYVHETYAVLPADCRGLLVTLEYPQHEKDGPPFSVEEREVDTLYSPTWAIDRLERRDILSRETSFQEEGVTNLHTVAYRLLRR